MLFTIAIIVERLAPSLEDRLTSEHSLSLQYTSRFEEVESIAEITISELGDEREDALCELNICIPLLYSAHVFLHESGDLCFADRFEDIGATARE